MNFDFSIKNSDLEKINERLQNPEKINSGRQDGEEAEEEENINKEDIKKSIFTERKQTESNEKLFPVLTAVSGKGCYFVSFYVDTNDQMRILTKLERLYSSDTYATNMVKCKDMSLLIFCRDGQVMNVFSK